MKDKKEHLTISKVAKLAKVSTATVSRVLNSPEKVSEKTRTKVERVIEKYNYVPDQVAKNFSTSSSSNIAIFIYDLLNPFYTRLIAALNSVTFENNYSLVICDTHNDEELEIKYMQYLKRIKVAGIIITEGTSNKILNFLPEDIPCVVIDRRGAKEDGENKFPFITSDNEGGAAMATNYLIRLKHKKIAIAGDIYKMDSVTKRFEGFSKTLKDNGIELKNEYVYECEADIKNGIKAAEYFISLKEVPTAIFCANDLLAEGVIQRLISLGVKIPDEISVMGFDGVLDNLIYPKLTTVRQAIDKIAKKSFDIIVKKNLNKEVDLSTIFETNLIIGDTVKVKDQ